MGEFPGEQTIEALSAELEQQRPLPEDPAQERIVYWHVFRRPEDVLTFARGISLESDEVMVGGHTHDSIGHLYWVGVQVDDLEVWGNRAAIHKVDGYDPENPGSPML